jgi:ABC-2 type transport system ATP-binding protein
MMPDPAIRLRGLTKHFGKLAAVSQVDLDVPAGRIVGFLGPNGAGKTTTMRMLTGALRPTAGIATVLNGSLARDVALRRRVGYLPGDLRIDPALTGAQLFAWYGRLRGGFDSRRVAELVDRLDLDPSRPFGTLSKGNRQKVGIVQVLQHDPDVLILDEPTTGLDPLAQREFLSLIRQAAARGAAVLFSSHVLPEVERIADRVAIIRAGRLIAESTVDQLLDRARRRLELRFAEPVTADLFEAAPGVADVHIDDHTATITIDGPVGPALHAATSKALLLRVSPAAGDEAAGTFELLVANPIGRSRVALARYGGLLVLLVALSVVCAATLAALARSTGLTPGVTIAQLVAATAASSLVALVFATLAYAIGAATGSRTAAVGIATALAVAGYVTEGLSHQVPALRVIRPGNPWHWLLADDPLANGLTWHITALSLAVSCTLVAASLPILRWRDLRYVPCRGCGPTTGGRSLPPPRDNGPRAPRMTSGCSARVATNLPWLEIPVRADIAISFTATRVDAGTPGGGRSRADVAGCQGSWVQIPPSRQL